jgi:hypothetical protein
MNAYVKTVPHIAARIKAGASAYEVREEFLPEALDMYREEYTRVILKGYDGLCAAYKQLCISEGDVFSSEDFVKYLLVTYNVCPKVFKDMIHEDETFAKHKKLIDRVLSKYSVQLLDDGIYENRMDMFWLQRQVQMIRAVFNVHT